MTNESITLGTARQNFIDYLKSHKRSISTILAYGKDIEQMTSFLESQKINQISEITSQNLEDFKKDLDSKNYTPKSISRKLNSIKTFFRFLQAGGIIAENAALAVTHPKYEVKPPRILSRMEYRALRDSCRDDVRMSAIVELMLQTGVRIGEIARLELEDIKNDNLYVKAYESQSDRDIPLNKTAKDAVDQYLTQRSETKSKALYVTKTGRPLLVRNIRTALDRYFRLAGLNNVKVNDLRNTWIAYQLAAGTSVVLLSKIAGHKRLSTTEKYLQALDVDENKGKTKLEEL